jgi:hypothetical protein
MRAEDAKVDTESKGEQTRAEKHVRGQSWRPPLEGTRVNYRRHRVRGVMEAVDAFEAEGRSQRWYEENRGVKRRQREAMHR